MAKQTFKKTRENEEKKQYQFESLLKLTRAYQQFLQKYSQAVEEEIQDHIAFQNRPDQKRKGKGEFDPESLWIFRFFCWSTESGRVSAELGRRMGYTPTQLAVRVISDAGYFMTMDGKVNPEGAPILKDGRFLTLELDLSESKKVIKQQIDFFLNTFHPKVRHLSKKRGGNILEPEETDKMIRVYELVENESGNVLHATWKMYPGTNGKQPAYDDETNRRWHNINDWHHKISEIIRGL
ncbi:MAG: hypothetical protein ABSF52_10075 [Syntrophobacteraceae bacterium]|jgi:hypothetical protein